MTITERIDTLLAERGMSRRQLAVAAGIPTSSFQAAMARGRNMTVEVLQAVAKALDVSPAYLLGQESVSLSPSLQQAFLDTLLERISEKLMSTDSTDLIEQFGTNHPYQDIYEGYGTLTFERVREIADDLGVPLEYLISGKNDPADHYPFVDDDLQSQIDTADARLIDMVHRICGMDPRRAYFPQDWNPAKIDLVREYLKDSKAILQKMFAATGQKGSANSE